MMDEIYWYSDSDGDNGDNGDMAIAMVTMVTMVIWRGNSIVYRNHKVCDG